jgi:acyl-CoA reductase-like NAD-dependent aldehyde dehydrogenase
MSKKSHNTNRFLPPKPLETHGRSFGMNYPAEVHSLINGKLEKGKGASWDLIYPATEQVIAKVSGCNAGQVSTAASSAHEAFKSGDWSEKPLMERQNIFRKIADKIDENADELAFIQTCETGIPYSQFRGMHVARAAQNFRFFAEVASTLSGETYTQTGKFLTYSIIEPVGVGAVIAPWNAPLALASMKIAACMITGNSCLVKPSEQTPYSILRMVELMLEAGMPSKAIHVINGSGAEAGAAMVTHKDVGAINFVGGTHTGQRIMEAASQGLKKLSLELGGKSANIITETADLGAAVDGSLLGIFAGNGEQCLAGSRILVQRDIADEFLNAFVERASNIAVGDPFNPETEIGPLAFSAHYNRVLSFVDKVGADDGEILTGGKHPDPSSPGLFITPVVAKASTNANSICQEEIFGPFASIVIYDSLEQAIEIANDSDFGLVSYVWTQDIQTMMTASRKIQAGTVWINTPMARDLRAPFGGYKKSGIGRDGLPGSIELFTEQKTVMIPQDKFTIPKLGSSS